MRTLMLLCLIMVLGAEDRVKVLLTAFGPFDGRGINGSNTLLQGIALDEKRYEVRKMTLPVTWTSVEEQVTPVLTSWQPDVIIGLGEGKPGFVAIETLAVNQRKGPDVAGKEPDSQVIDSSGPDKRRSSLLLQLDKIPPTRVPIVLSQDAGRYLCNQTLYQFTANKATQAGFIHVPPQGKVDDATYRSVLLPAIQGIILASVAPLEQDR